MSVSFYDDPPSTVEGLALNLVYAMLQHCQMAFFEHYAATFGRREAMIAEHVVHIESPQNFPFRKEYGLIFDDAVSTTRHINTFLVRYHNANTLYDNSFRYGIEFALKNSADNAAPIEKMSRYSASSIFCRNVRNHPLQRSDSAMMKYYLDNISLASNAFMLWLSKHDTMKPVLSTYSDFFEQRKETINKHYITDTIRPSAMDLATRTDLILMSHLAIKEVTTEYDNAPWEWIAPIIAGNIAENIAEPSQMELLCEYFLQQVKDNPPQRDSTTIKL